MRGSTVVIGLGSLAIIGGGVWAFVKLREAKRVSKVQQDYLNNMARQQNRPPPPLPPKANPFVTLANLLLADDADECRQKCGAQGPPAPDCLKACGGTAGLGHLGAGFYAVGRND